MLPCSVFTHTHTHNPHAGAQYLADYPTYLLLSINGHVRYENWRHIPYKRPMQGYVKNIYALIWYRTSIVGSRNSQ